MNRVVRSKSGDPSSVAWQNWTTVNNDEFSKNKFNPIKRWELNHCCKVLFMNDVSEPVVSSASLLRCSFTFCLRWRFRQCCLHQGKCVKTGFHAFPLMKAALPKRRSFVTWLKITALKYPLSQSLLVAQPHSQVADRCLQCWNFVTSLPESSIPHYRDIRGLDL